MLTDGQRVADYLGVDLTGLQLIQVDRLLPAADQWIARYTGRAFGLDAPLTGERHTPMGGLVFLRNRPVASVQAVRLRSWYIGATSEALVPSVSYELVDGEAGVLAVSSHAVGNLLEVDYTPGQTVPGDVAHAATVLVASWLRPTIDAERGASAGAIKSYAIGSELNVTYDTSATASSSSATGGVPDDVLTLLAPYRQGMVFA